MANVFRVGITRLASPGLSQRLCKVTGNHNVVQIALISGRAKRQHLSPKPAPFPYWKKKYTVWHRVADPMMYRFDENTKIISVEGPLASGKKEFAKKLAEELDMLYMPPPTFDDLFINLYNVDLRKYDFALPPGAQSCDVNRYLMDPHHINVPLFQWQYAYMKYEQYMNALLHMLSTGQGVVLTRCVHSDGVFLNAMHRAGYVSNAFVYGYNYNMQYALRPMCRPHLIVYLDSSVEKVKENIKKRNNPCEVNSKVLSTQYLSDIEDLYKDDFLKNIERHSNVLVYDSDACKDIPWIVHDIEKLNFDASSEPNDKLGDWSFDTSVSVATLRDMCQEQVPLFSRLTPKNEEMPDELYFSMEECAAYEEIIAAEPTEVYEPGFTPDRDDFMNILFTAKPDYIAPLFRRRIRDFDYRDESLERYKAAYQK